MIAVITGDIINSRVLSIEWIDLLKDALGHLSNEQVKWEIFRGDSFQVELAVEDALLYAIYIKASMRTLKNADVRMGIGIGEKKNDAERIGEANGEAFINSGLAFDTLKVNKVNLSVKSPWNKFDEEMNLLIRLALIAMDSWRPTTSEIVKYAIENENIPQQALAALSGRSQSSISEALKRAHFTEILEVVDRFNSQVLKLIKA